MSTVSMNTSGTVKRTKKVVPARSMLLDKNFEKFRKSMTTRFHDAVNGGVEPVFHTDVNLWSRYLGLFPLAVRQHYNCNCCRKFVETYGNLVTIDDVGNTKPVIWEPNGMFQKLYTAVAKARVTGVFVPETSVLGTPSNLCHTAPDGIWSHLAVKSVPDSMIHSNKIFSASQKAAEKLEDLKNINRALGEFRTETLEKAVALLKSDALYQSEKVLGPAQWLLDLKVNTIHGINSTNKVWKAVATAPAGFCHPRSSMVGTLLEDLESGMDFNTVKKRFAEKMHPLSYQRPQAAPSAGTIAQAEKIFEKLEAAGSLGRRFARLDEIEVLWKPEAPRPQKSSVGLFESLTPKGVLPKAPTNIGRFTMTWDKFQRTVMPTAAKITMLVPNLSDYCGLVTAVNPDAPPILQWDTAEQRNPVSWYLYHNGSTAQRWGLEAGSRVNVTAITQKPNQWFNPEKAKHHGEGIILILEGAVDRQSNSLCIFPSTLKSDFHGIRSVIEAYSNKHKLQGTLQASACGLMLGSTGRPAVELTVTTSDNLYGTYLIDRMD